MSRPRIGLSLCLWSALQPGEVRPEELIELAAEIGYDALEMVPEALWPEVRAQGLAIATKGGHDSLEDGLNRYENGPRIEDELRQSIAIAAENEIPVLICFSGNRAAAGARGTDATVANLARVVPLAEEAGVTLAVEYLNSRRDHPGYEFDNLDWGLEVCRRLGSPRVKILFDIYHAQVMEGDLVNAIERGAASIGHFHLAGNPGRHEPDDSQEIHFPAVLRHVARSGYRGFVGHEYIPTMPLARSLAASVSMCRDALGVGSEEG